MKEHSSNAAVLGWSGAISPDMLEKHVTPFLEE
jgi:hypothetical protein